MYQQMVTDTLSKATEKGIIPRDPEASAPQAHSETAASRNGDGGKRSRWGDAAAVAAERSDSPPAATGWGEADTKVSEHAETCIPDAYFHFC